MNDTDVCLIWLLLQTFMDLTKLAVVLATSLADWTNCLLAIGLGVLEEANLQALQSAEVCLATMVAAESTCMGRVMVITFRLNNQSKKSDKTDNYLQWGKHLPGIEYKLGPPGSDRPSE